MSMSKEKNHTAAIFKEYTTPSRVLRSFTNLSNTVIQTALSGQNKFVYEILQNADDSFDDGHRAIEVQFILQNNYLVVHHNGKGFDYNDVERICDYASQIEEVKEHDLSKTGYKGLGFKSLFNLSDCIYVYSNGYSFRFDKTHWTDASSRPWQVIPIWCNFEELPLNEQIPFDQPVNFILRINNASQLKKHLQDLVEHSELLLYLNHINKLRVTFDSKTFFLEKKVEKVGLFNKVDFYNNQNIVSTWLLRTYRQDVPPKIRSSISGASRFIYPEKIKTAKEVPFTFALRSNKTMDEISSIRGLCHSTLPTQLHLTLPYHINSFFILNLDRTQLHENEWNEFLIYQIGRLQFSLLKDLAEVSHLKNYVIQLFVRKIQHSYATFNNSFLKGFNEAKTAIAWLPAHQGTRLLKLGEAWVDETRFFKQNFQNIRHEKIEPFLIDYNVNGQESLLASEAQHFTYGMLFREFPSKYYLQLTKSSYINFITYLYESLKHNFSHSSIINKLRDVHFLVGKNKTLLRPRNAFLEETENPIPDFLMLNPVDNDYLPSNNNDLIKQWLVLLGAKRLSRPIQVVRESVLKWLDYNFPKSKYEENHIEIISYLAKDVDQLTNQETEKLKNNLCILTEGKKFEKGMSCYFPDAVSVRELEDVISDDYKISSSYDLHSLRRFFIDILGVNVRLDPFDVLQKFIMWIKNGEAKRKLTKNNYSPIIEYISEHYPSVKRKLARDELKNMPILTLDQSFQKAQDCYFDSAVLNVKGLECVIPKNKLISTENISDAVRDFLSEIGVSVRMSPTKVLRGSVLKWIQENQIENKITSTNHYDILEYIAKEWDALGISGLQLNEKETLTRIPILTKNNTFKEAFKCYIPNDPSDISKENIPDIDSIISSSELVSEVYNKSDKIMILLPKLGVHNLRFTDVYEKYSDHLTRRENVNWFFSSLNKYWSTKVESSRNADKLLKYLQEKFKSSPRLLAKNREMYRSTDLYCSQFKNMHQVDPNTIPLLDFKDRLETDLEKWLGFRDELELTCITRLLEAVRGKPDLGAEKTQEFFTALLQQLRQKKKNEIQKYSLNLLSERNELKPAKELFYFREEDAICCLKSCYLKRIHGMSHKETLELAELCGVNIFPFKKEITFGQGEPIYDNTLKEFYLERLPFIALQESKKLIESHVDVLERLHDKINSIELYKCRKIFVQYPFGNPCEIVSHFDGLKIYVTGRWNTMEKSTLCGYLNAELGLKTDITRIIDMEPKSEDKELWLRCNNESFEKLQIIENELKELRSAEDSTLNIFEDENSVVGSPSRKKKSSSRRRGNRSKSNRKKSGSLQVDDTGDDDLKHPTSWLGEKHVFTFLQDHYKKKYPNSQFNLSGGTFTLQWQESLKLKLIWLNECEDKGLSYDLLLMKNDAVERLIEVESTNAEQDDSFILSYGEFIRRINNIAKELPQHKEKYCIYRAFNVQNPSTATCVLYDIPSALYKIVPLEFP